MAWFRTLILASLLTGVAVASEAAHGAGEEPSLFSGTVADALWTVIAFIVLVAVLGKVAWRPLIETLQARQTQIETQLTSAAESKSQAEKLLADFKEQGATLLREASERSQQEHKLAAEKAQEEITVMRRQAMEDLDNARHAAQEQLWREAGDVVLELGTSVLGHAVTADDDGRMMDEAIAKMKEARQGNA